MKLFLTFNSVALECMIDECANESNIDPIDYRLSMLDMGKTIYEWSGWQLSLALNITRLFQ